MNYLIPDNRETAALIWLVVLSAWIASKKDLRGPVSRVFRTAVQPKILLTVIIMCGYVAVEVWLASKISLWRPDLLKPTLIWLASALVMLLYFERSIKEPRFYRRSVVEVIGVAAVLSFFMNVVVMSLPVELVAQPIIVFLAMISVVAGHNKQHRSVKKFGSSEKLVG